MRLFQTFLLALFLSGCTYKAKYMDLQAQYEEEVTKSQKQQERIRELERELQRARAKANARLESYRELVREFKPLVDRGVLEVKVEDGRIVVGMAADVLFPSGSAELSEEGRANVAEIARILARHRDREFQVEGHTDDQPIHTEQFPNNWYLGAARAINVLDVLVENGMSRDQLSAATFADTRPVASNDTEEGRAQNRRIEIVLLPDLSDLPGYKALMDEGAPPRGKRPPRRRRPPRPHP